MLEERLISYSFPFPWKPSPDLALSWFYVIFSLENIFFSSAATLYLSLSVRASTLTLNVCNFFVKNIYWISLKFDETLIISIQRIKSFHLSLEAATVVASLRVLLISFLRKFWSYLLLVDFGLPTLRLPWGFHFKDWLIIHNSILSFSYKNS